MKEFKQNMEISDSELIDSFIETNCFIRLAIIKRLRSGWQESNEKKQFALAVAIIEQFMALTEILVMLLYAMIEKGQVAEESLFYHYLKVNISEREDANSYSTKNLRQKLSTRQTNSEFCDLWGLDIKKLDIEPKGDDMRKGTDILLDILDNYRCKIPLVQAYNKIKHGMLVRYKIIDSDIYIQNIIGMQSINDKVSNAEVTGFTANSTLLEKLEDNAKIISENIQALLAIIREGYL